MSRRTAITFSSLRRPAGVALLAVTCSIGLVLAAGCASTHGIAPHDAPLAPQAVGVRGAAGVPLPSNWWQDYHDPALNALVERALADSPSLKLAQARIAGAQAAVGGAQAARGPRLDGEADVSRQRYSANGIFPPPLGGATLNSGTAQLTGSWELDFFGRHRAALDAAVGSARAAQADEQAARNLIAANVVAGYVQLARLLKQQRVAERALAQRTDTLALVRQRVKAGLDSTVELREAEGALPDTRRRIEALAEQAALQRHALAALTVQPPDALDALAPAALPTPLAALPAVIPGDLLARRADVVAARWRVEAAAREVDVAKAEFYPSINLMAFAGLSAIGLDRLFQSGSRQMNAGAAVHLPIFDAGALRANLGARAAEVDAAMQGYNATVLDAVREVADQLASLRSVQRQAAEQRQAQDAAEAAYALARQRYQAGLGNYLIVLQAQTSVLEQRRLHTDLQARTLAVQVALARALGGGYTAQAPASLAASQPITRTAATGHDAATAPAHGAAAPARDAASDPEQAS